MRFYIGCMETSSYIQDIGSRILNCAYLFEKLLEDDGHEVEMLLTEAKGLLTKTCHRCNPAGKAVAIRT